MSGIYFGYPKEGYEMVTKVQKWGNSQGLRLSKELLSDADLEVGDAVSVTVQDGSLVITPVRRVRGGQDLEQIVKRIRKGYRPEELDWGHPVGREVW
jgi:antitoxin MazE